MRLRLERIDTRRLTIDLGGEAAEGTDRRVVVRSAAGLQGLVEQTAAGLRLEDVRAEHVVLDALRLVFGSVLLQNEGEGVVSQLQVAYDSRGDQTILELRGHVRAEHLAVDIGSIHVHGTARIEGMRVRIEGAKGCIEAEQVSFSKFVVRFGTTEVSADEIAANRLVIAWGDVFRMQAQSLVSPAAELASGGVRLRSEALDVHAFSLHGGRVSFDRATIGGAAIEASPQRTRDPTGEPPTPTDAASRPRPFDWRLLDGLHGELNVDLAVDLTVPVIGRRHATHRFRIPIEDGSIDYIRLENDLSTLENTLLDFAVRDGALVLERGIPLLPTRGRGKPIVIWRLEDDDLALAQRRRVRLAVLPEGRLANDSPDDEKKAEPSGPPSVALRRLGLHNIEARIGLTPIDGPLHGIFQMLRFEKLSLAGEVHHHPAGDGRAGLLQAELAELEAVLGGLPLGGSRLHVERLQLAHASQIEVSFTGLRPSTIRLELAGLGLGRTELRDR